MTNPVIYIKLGSGGKWAKDCFENNYVKISFTEISSDIILTKDEILIRSEYEKVCKSKQEASNLCSQLLLFLNTNEKTIWITFYNQQMYWCTAESEFHLIKSPLKDNNNTKIKKCISCWAACSKKGEELTFNNLSGKLLKTQGFRGTVCTPDAWDYVLKKINDEEDEELINLKDNKINLLKTLNKVVKSLYWDDFELLIDLLFLKGGFQRNSEVGAFLKEIDLNLYHPVLNLNVFVQIKCECDYKTYDDWKQMAESQPCDLFYFVCNIPKGKFIKYKEENKKFHLLKDIELAEMILLNGLLDWVIKKSK